MTLQQLIAAVPVRRDPRSLRLVVAVTDIPRPWADQCFIALAGHPLAGAVAPYGACIFADDWLRWVRGELALQPIGLDSA